MFDLTIQADDRGLAIGFNGISTAANLDNPVRQRFAQDGTEGLDFRLQVLDITPGPRVGHDGRDGEHAPGLLGGLKAFD